MWSIALLAPLIAVSGTLVVAVFVAAPYANDLNGAVAQLAFASLLLAAVLVATSRLGAVRAELVEALLVQRLLRSGAVFSTTFPSVERTMREALEEPLRFPVRDYRGLLEESRRNGAVLMRFLCGGLAALAQITVLFRVGWHFASAPRLPSVALCVPACTATGFFWIALRDVRRGQVRRFRLIDGSWTLWWPRAEPWANRYRPERSPVVIPAAPVSLLIAAPLVLICIVWAAHLADSLSLAKSMLGTQFALAIAWGLWTLRAGVDGDGVKWWEARLAWMTSLSAKIARILVARRAVAIASFVTGVGGLVCWGIIMAAPDPHPLWVEQAWRLVGAPLLAWYAVCWMLLRDERPPAMTVRVVNGAEWLHDVVGPKAEEQITNRLFPTLQVLVVMICIAIAPW